MRVLVTGATGFLGSHIAEQLKAQGHEVRCLVRKTSNTEFLDELGVERVVGAVDDPDSLPDAVRGVDAVVHSAGIVKAKTPADFDRVNHIGARDLAQATLEHAPGVKRFVLVSSAGVMGPGLPDKPHRIDDATNPVTHYGRSKLAGEHAVLALKDELPVTVIRPPAIYGPRDAEILALFKTIRRGFAFRLGDSLRAISMVFGPDCARACIRAIDADVPSGSIYFVEDGQAYSFTSMTDAVADAYGVKLWAKPRIPPPVLRVAAAFSEMYAKVANKAVIFNRDKLNELLMQDFLVDSSDARTALEWQPEVMFPEGAQLTAKWYTEHGWD